MRPWRWVLRCFQWISSARTTAGSSAGSAPDHCSETAVTRYTCCATSTYAFSSRYTPRYTPLHPLHFGMRYERPIPPKTAKNPKKHHKSLSLRSLPCCPALRQSRSFPRRFFTTDFRMARMKAEIERSANCANLREFFGMVFKLAAIGVIRGLSWGSISLVADRPRCVPSRQKSC